MPVHPSTDDLDRLVAAVRDSRRYAQVEPGLIRAIGAAELAKRGAFKDAVKATKNKLHQAGGMFLAEGALPYARWLEALRGAAEGERPALLRQIMRNHASTRERLPVLDAFYATVLDGIGPIHSVLDLACGLNPLAAPWMPLAPGARYHAVDIFADMMAFVGAALAVLGVACQAEVRDVLHDPPGEPAHVAFLLKAIPCLEQLDRAASSRLLDTIRAQHIVISFPTRTVGGRDVGMRTSYAERFERMIAGEKWRVARYEFAGELAYRLSSE